MRPVFNRRVFQENMTAKIRILFIVNGLGLGNSTRCHAVIQRLVAYGVTVDVVTSGNGLWYFREQPEPENLFEVEALYYASNNGQISIAGTILSIAEFWRILKTNAAKLETILDRQKYDAVVVDSIYNWRPIKRRGIPFAALNNADMVHFGYRRFKDRPKSTRAQFYVVEESDYFFHKSVPDLVLSPTFDLSLAEAGPPYHRIGPIVRSGCTPSSIQCPARRVLVMLSGSRFGSPVSFSQAKFPFEIDVVGREAPPDAAAQKGVNYHGRVLNSLGILQKSDIAVVNGGFSAVSEAFYARRPLVVVPIPNHAEQWVNARMIEHLGVGMIGSEDNIEADILTAFSRLSEFQSGYDQLPAPEDGADEAAKILINFASG
jgi:UDP:flavonoid glycosyltransferase YjiC (YdhE family)